MDNYNQYIELMDEYKDNLDFRVEYKIIEITENICKIMGEKGHNRADLAGLLETSKSAVTKMLGGDTNFTLKRLIKIAMSLDKDIDINFKDSVQKVDFNNPVSVLKDTTSSEIIFGGGNDNEPPESDEQNKPKERREFA